MSTGEAGQSTQKNNNLEGKYFLCKVVDNNDPLKLKRVKIGNTDLLGDGTRWALALGDDHGGGISGQAHVSIPPVGAVVYVMFQEGNRDYPMYVGSANSHTAPIPAALATNYPNRHGVGFPDGAFMLYDVSTKEMLLRDGTGNTVSMRPNGITAASTTQITATAASSITATAGSTINATAGASATVTAPTINLTGNVVVSGNLTVGGAGGGASQITGNFNVIGTLTNNGVQVGSSHVHTSSSPGTDTSTPH